VTKTPAKRELTFGYSPCPNDTFAFHALTYGLVDAPFRITPVLLDIEELNRRAHHGEFDLTKLSVGAFAAVGDRYRLLRSGAALGEGVGPLVITRTPMSLEEAVRGRVAIPGRETTAFNLLRLAAPTLGEVVELRYDRILDAVSNGDVHAGLIIHESRFTYQDHGLHKAVDLGDWWTNETGLPVPLAGICARTDLAAEITAAAERAIRASVQYAFDHPEASREYVQANAQEMSPSVQAQHIALYVNQFSLDIGDEGMRAIARLTRADLASSQHENLRPPALLGGRSPGPVLLE
jgi:1,4-dihydroxy-6-naphthoate synthase